MLDLIKECPACGHANAPEESFCTECDYDLLTVPVTRSHSTSPGSLGALSKTPNDEEASSPGAASNEGQAGALAEDVQAGQSAQRFRLEGEAANGVAGAPAVDASPSFQLEVDAQPETCRLELVEDPSFSFAILPGQTVGRGVEADVMLGAVPHARYISRRHALFSRRGGQWFVQYLGSGNYIKVDGEVFEDDSLAALHNGSVLTLSLTSFRVVLE